MNEWTWDDDKSDGESSQRDDGRATFPKVSSQPKSRHEDHLGHWHVSLRHFICFRSSRQAAASSTPPLHLPAFFYPPMLTYFLTSHAIIVDSQAITKNILISLFILVVRLAASPTLLLE